MTVQNPPSYELSKSICDSMAEIPIRLSHALTIIRDMETAACQTATGASVQIVLESGSKVFKAESLSQFYAAMELARGHALACLMIGKEMQGPILIDTCGRRWVITGIEVDADSQRFPFIVHCRRVAP